MHGYPTRGSNREEKQMNVITEAILVAVLFALAGVRAPNAEAAAATQPTTRPLVLVFTGESNSGGIGPNARATPAELGPRACVQIMNFTNQKFSFEDLRIGVNNLCDHAGLEGYYGKSHGWEMELANAVADGAFAGHERVYLIKTGQGGSKIAQWAEDGPAWRKFVQRTEAGRKQLPADARWVVWLSLGINDALARTPIATWKTQVVAHLGRIRKQLPGATIVMTQFQSMGYPEINQAIAQIAAAEPDVLAVDSTGAKLLDANHWDYDGLKTVTRRLIDATHQALSPSTAATTTRTSTKETP
jgi:hypothetical protein